MEIVITWYEDWMQNQVIEMFEKEYHVSKNYFDTYFSNFYLHPFQTEKCILIVALDGNTVAGFQSFFYWPYSFNSKTFNTFQSGNSLVHPGYRGKGIFQKMLRFIHEHNQVKQIDCLLGFPVKASYNNFIKDNWKNICNLQWYVKICNPFALLFNRMNISGFTNGIDLLETQEQKLRLNLSPGFQEWRNTYSGNASYFSFRFDHENASVVFHLKKNKRKKILSELIIGNILVSNPSETAVLLMALRQLVKRSWKHFNFISVALNESSSPEVISTMQKLKFRRSDKQIYFIVKPFNNDNLFTEPKNWILYRSDIDTW